MRCGLLNINELMSNYFYLYGLTFYIEFVSNSTLKMREIHAIYERVYEKYKIKMKEKILDNKIY